MMTVSVKAHGLREQHEYDTLLSTGWGMPVDPSVRRTLLGELVEAGQVLATRAGRVTVVSFMGSCESPSDLAVRHTDDLEMLDHAQAHPPRLDSPALEELHRHTSRGGRFHGTLGDVLHRVVRSSPALSINGVPFTEERMPDLLGEAISAGLVRICRLRNGDTFHIFIAVERIRFSVLQGLATRGAYMRRLGRAGRLGPNTTGAPVPRSA